MWLVVAEQGGSSRRGVPWVWAVAEGGEEGVGFVVALVWRDGRWWWRRW